MNPLSYAITAAICAGALLVDAGASGVLVNAALGMAAVLLLRNAVIGVDPSRLVGMPPARLQAQLALLRVHRPRRQARIIARLVAVYGLTPRRVADMTPECRLKERERLEILLSDLDRIARILPARVCWPDHARLRRALAARAGAGAPSYASIFDAAWLALDEASWPRQPDAAAA